VHKLIEERLASLRDHVSSPFHSCLLELTRRDGRVGDYLMDEDESVKQNLLLGTNGSLPKPFEANINRR
jgi:hypothetical protein